MWRPAPMTLISTWLCMEHSPSIFCRLFGMPRLFLNLIVNLHRLFRSKFDWGFQSEDEKFRTSEGVYLCRGKVMQSSNDGLSYAFNEG